MCCNKLAVQPSDVALACLFLLYAPKIAWVAWCTICCFARLMLVDVDLPLGEVDVDLPLGNQEVAAVVGWLVGMVRSAVLQSGRVGGHDSMMIGVGVKVLELIC